MTDQPMVKAEAVCKNFGALQVLKGVTLEIGRGQVLVLIGPSGSGKSTFLRCINHLEQINGGRLYVDGELIGYRERGDKLYEMSPRDAARQRRDIGMVFQYPVVYRGISVYRNIELPLQSMNLSKQERKQRSIHKETHGFIPLKTERFQ